MKRIFAGYMSGMHNHQFCANGSITDDQEDSNDEELLAIGRDTNPCDSTIDEALAALEDVVFSAEFSELQDDYFDRHCNQFDDSDENRLYYTEIFNDYGRLLDEYLSGRIKEKLPSFNLNSFASWLLTHEDEIAGDIVELIHSTTDFLHFKAVMLEHKKAKMEKEGGQQNASGNRGILEIGEDIDLSQSLSIRSCHIHSQ